MTLIINNAEVAKVLTMEASIAALEESYLQLAAKEAVCRPGSTSASRPAIPPAIINGAPWKAARPRAISRSG